MEYMSSICCGRHWVAS